MLKLLYAIAKAIPALQKILDKLFREGRVLSASKAVLAAPEFTREALKTINRLEYELEKK